MSDDAPLASRAADRATEVALRALLPVLLHRVKNATQTLVGVDALFTSSEAARYGANLAGASKEIDELGWWLGVLSNGLGADTLVERVERDRLDSLANWARYALRRADRDLGPNPSDLPRIALGPREARAFAWRFVATLTLAGRTLEPGAALEWKISSSRAWTIELATRLDDDARAFVGALAPSELELEAVRTLWRVPADWLAAR